METAMATLVIGKVHATDYSNAARSMVMAMEILEMTMAMDI